ncbi:MAG TPA: DNA polymerase III subunit delta' [Rhodanobacteraceae bacterium]
MNPPRENSAGAAPTDGPLPPWCRPAWNLLAARAAQGTLPHALLVCGPAGLGKRGLVDAFARACLCETPADGRACGDCRGCRLLAAGTHPDYVRVALEINSKTGNARQEIVVDQIRALSERLAMASQLGGRQVAVIDPAEAMNAAAQNALLKTLEEPTAASLIVLVSDRPWRLVATIRSRCQRLDVALPPRADALQWLAAEAPGGAEAALTAAGGNPGEALRLLQEGGMQRRHAVAVDLAALATGRGDARAISKAWAADEPLQRLEFAARLLADALRARAQRMPAAFDPGWSDTALVAQFDAADRLRVLLDGPLRTDLALFGWLAGLPGGGS